MPAPWTENPALLPALEAWDGRGAFELPDEQRDDPSRVRFASGAWDGIATHHMAAAGEHEEAKVVHQVVSALAALVRHDTDARREALYASLQPVTVAPYADALLAEVARQEDYGPDDLRPHARWLVHHAAHREPLKLGILLLGLCGDEDDLASLRTLARHDEFTLFAAVAVANLLDDPLDMWWEMARDVHGWGKIQLVERLCRRAEGQPELQDWLLRAGCANEIMPEYLAHACAEAGNLAAALADDADDELLDGACLIVGALLTGGPAPDMDSYEDGVPAAGRLLAHLQRRCHTLKRLEAVNQLRRWLTAPADEETTAARDDAGWTPEVRLELAAACDAILSRPEWPERVKAAFASEDANERSRAWDLGPAVGVDLWEDGYARLDTDALDSTLWFHLARTTSLARLRRVVERAEELLPLGEVATGPGDSIGLGPDFKAHLCLESVLQELPRGEVFSERLAVAALRSPVVRGRNLALNVLEKVPAARWGMDLREAVRQTLADEVRDDLRERLATLANAISDA